jgi:tryptophan-rich sensory protein
MAIVVLIVALALVFALAAFGSRFPPREWYKALDKPPWTPPNRLFDLAAPLHRFEMKV